MVVLGVIARSAADAGPIHDAAEAGKVDEVRRLLDSGTDVDGASGTGLTPLRAVAVWGLEMLPFCSFAGLVPRGAPRILNAPLPVVPPPFRADPGRYAGLEIRGQRIDVGLVHLP